MLLPLISSQLESPTYNMRGNKTIFLFAVQKLTQSSTIIHLQQHYHTTHAAIWKNSANFSVQYRTHTEVGAKKANTLVGAIQCICSSTTHYSCSSTLQLQHIVIVVIHTKIFSIQRAYQQAQYTAVGAIQYICSSTIQVIRRRHNAHDSRCNTTYTAVCKILSQLNSTDEGIYISLIKEYIYISLSVVISKIQYTLWQAQYNGHYKLYSFLSRTSHACRMIASDDYTNINQI